MRLEVREVRPEDAPALQALQGRCPQGTSLVISAVNEPDFLARARASRSHGVFVATADGRIVGSAACAVRDGLANGEPRKIGYEFQYFTSPAERGKGIARQLRARIERTLVEAGAALSYALIMEGNEASMRLFAGQGFRAHRTLEAAMTLVYRPEPVAADGTLRPADPADYPAIVRLLDETWGRCDLYEPPSVEQLAAFVERTPGFDPAQLLVLERAGAIVACLGYWDWARVTRITVLALNRRLRIAAGVLDLVRHLRPAPRIRRPGETLQQWVLAPMAFRDPRDLRPLVRELNNRALARDAHSLVAVAEPGQPVFRGFQGLMRVGVGVHLYVKALQPLALGGAPICVSGVDL